MRFKRAGLAAFAAALLATGITACGGADNNKSSNSGGSNAGGAPAVVPGFDGTTIKLGVITPLTGPVAVIGLPLTTGNEVYFDRVNAAGGIAGKYKVELVQEDSQYQPDIAVQKYNKLKSGVVAFTQILGTPSTLAVLPQLKADNIIAAPASLDATWIRQPNLIPVSAPYQIQAINALDYYVNLKNGKGKKICSFIQNDAYGEAGQAGVDFAATKLGFKVATTQKFKVGDKDVTGQVQQLQKNKCDAVWLTATPSDAGTIWGTAAKLGFTPQWIAQSPSYIGALAKSPLGPYMAKFVWIASDGSSWGDTRVPGMVQMIADMKKFKPKQGPDFYVGFGYNQGVAITALLEKAVADGDLSRAGLMKASNELGSVDFQGLTGNYTYGPAAKRNPPRSTTIFKVRPDKPAGLATQKFNYESPFAKQYVIPAS
jgi:ABC-type branched-subunit amino acid transport system substrate-binding protein